MKRIAFFVGIHINESQQHLTQPMGLGRGYAFVHPMDDGWLFRKPVWK